MKIYSGILVILSLVFGLSTASAALSPAQRLADFEQLVTLIERNYGPLHWKEKVVGLNWAAAVDRYRDEILAARDDAAFYRTLALFTAQLQDAHVSPIIPSNYRASLGFVCDLVEGKVLISEIDRLRLPESLFPFTRGDELLALGGMPVDQLLADIASFAPSGNELSSLRFAAMRLTNRSESSGLEVPKGSTTITVRPRGAADPITVMATWANKGTPLLELDDLQGRQELWTLEPPSSGDWFTQLKELPIFNLSLPASELREWERAGMETLGQRESFFMLPADAKPLPGVSMTAAIYERAGKRIGVLRIPAYQEKSSVETFTRAVYTLEQNTDVLVIDQTNNPGGSVTNMADIVSLFANKSFKDINFELRPSLNWLRTFQSVNQELSDILAQNSADATANALKPRFEFLEAEIYHSLQTRRFLSRRVSLNLTGSFGMIQPASAVHYSKPILLLINEFDFSAGDAFPAIMKDNGRATLFGAQTAGAGGNVREHGPLANSFFKVNLTESLMVRPNGEYIENQGVQPDIAYTVTEEDFLNGYRNYVHAFTVEALKLAGVSPEEFQAWERAQVSRP